MSSTVDVDTILNEDDSSLESQKLPQAQSKYPRSLDELLNMSSDSEEEGSEGSIDLEKLLGCDDENDNATPLAHSPVGDEHADRILADQRYMETMSVSFTDCPGLQEADKREQQWIHQGVKLQTSILELRQSQTTLTSWKIHPRYHFNYNIMMHTKIWTWHCHFDMYMFSIYCYWYHQRQCDDL